ncbi:MAG: alpha/beta hydrolase [candidate division KSB1 bacterium]|nr:alpha/beta hydrolase [candidate division KSB1 bacterium]MDZ7275325.1 alpha/beta hydrolase [candidate division KSB1 bacterium]MDZ7287492.1 alpha/beta hydrolase [candidate division KSB1 bacterium]MDZ7299606.1 alpha/beta hydrolase [candidate division KSB1 bacterium]MDZ7307456.1 alpha/beta hydrolase [candidate division KSB1 bacterium]
MWRSLLFLIAAFALLLMLLRLFERHFVFFPRPHPRGFWQPERFGLSVQDAYFTTAEGATLHGWFVPHPAPVASLLMAHGNAGNLSDRVEWLVRLQRQVPAHLFMFDYRGYGRSTGSPSEENCYRDAEAAYDWLHQHVPGLPIIAHGHSLGSAVVIELAGRRPLTGLIIEAGFTDAADMARLMFGGLPMGWLTSMKWASREKVAQLTLPKLFLHGDRDEVVPYSLGQKLFAAAAHPKHFVTLTGVDHNDSFLAGGENYYRVLRDFVQQCAAQASSTVVKGAP